MTAQWRVWLGRTAALFLVVPLVGLLPPSAPTAVDAAGNLYAGWGGNYSSQLLDETNANRRTPVAMQDLPAVTAIALSETHGLAIAPNGTVLAWGSNEF